MVKKTEKRGMTFFLLTVSVVLLSVGFITNVSANQEKLNDVNIRSAIIADLKSNDAVPSHLIDVKVNNGVVTLEGSVYNILEADKAVQVAESIKGVRSVVSLMEVKSGKMS
jgi:osmotically-inducible protein OsmY